MQNNFEKTILCHYCGKAVPEGDLTCAGCGTDIKLSGDDQKEANDKESTPWELNAKTATLILCLPIFPIVVCSVFILLIVGIVSGFNKLETVYLYRTFVTAAIHFVMPIVEGISTWVFCLCFLPNSIRDTNPTGAAWVWGGRTTLIKGFFIGIIFGVIATLDHHLLGAMGLHNKWRGVDVFSKLAITPGYTQVMFLISSVLFYPVAEEMIYRGVIYGGYRKSFGPVFAGVITSFIFVLGHSSVFHSYSALLNITMMSFVTLWCRLHWRSISPGIAAHSAYNAIILLSVIYRS